VSVGEQEDESEGPFECLLELPYKCGQRHRFSQNAGSFSKVSVFKLAHTCVFTFDENGLQFLAYCPVKIGVDALRGRLS
jgi:hypothetical protein